jgi:hypothetical protein
MYKLVACKLYVVGKVVFGFKKVGNHWSRSFEIQLLVAADSGHSTVKAQTPHTKDTFFTCMSHS